MNRPIAWHTENTGMNTATKEKTVVDILLHQSMQRALSSRGRNIGVAGVLSQLSKSHREAAMNHGMNRLIIMREATKTLANLVARNAPLMMIKRAIADGADVNDSTYAKMPMIHAALRRPDIVRELIRAGANVNVLMKGYTPLMRAVEDGNLNTMKVLVLDGRADVNLMRKEITTLAMAVETESRIGNVNEARLVKFLLEHGATPYDGKGNGNALYLAVTLGATPIVRLLMLSMDIQTPAGKKAFYAAIVSNQIFIAGMLLRAGVNIDQTYKYYSLYKKATALMIAVHLGKLEMVRFLIRSGANCNLRSRPYDNTALGIALLRANIEIIRLLIESRTKLGKDDLINMQYRNLNVKKNVINAIQSTNTLRSQLDILIHTDDVDSVRLILDRGVRPSNPNVSFFSFVENPAMRTLILSRISSPKRTRGVNASSANTTAPKRRAKRG